MKFPTIINIYFCLNIFIFFIYLAESRIDTRPSREPSYPLTHHVTLEVQTGNKPVETLVLGLYGKLVPKTVNNFVSLCKGTEIDGVFYTYVGIPFHRIIPNFMVQGGDVVSKNGTGSVSIYGDSFQDENFTAKHKKHVIAMANRGKFYPYLTHYLGPNTNGSQFYITTAATSWLNGHHVVFGELVDGEYVLQAIEATGTDSGVPSVPTVVKSCKVKVL